MKPQFRRHGGWGVASYRRAEYFSLMGRSTRFAEHTSHWVRV